MKHEDKKDIVSTAIEGGINYYAEILCYRPSAAQATIKITEPDAPAICNGLHYISTRTVTRGMEALKELDPKAYARLQTGDYDANDADECIQAGLFNALIFG